MLSSGARKADIRVRIEVPLHTGRSAVVGGCLVVNGGIGSIINREATVLRSTVS